MSLLEIHKYRLITIGICNSFTIYILFKYEK